MGGFLVQKIHVDGQFEGISEKLDDLIIFVNVTSRNKHVPEAEQCIRTIKERVRSTINTLPFKKIPHGIFVELVYSCVFRLNEFPRCDGILQKHSPRIVKSTLYT